MWCDSIDSLVRKVGCCHQVRVFDAKLKMGRCFTNWRWITVSERSMWMCIAVTWKKYKTALSLKTDTELRRNCHKATTSPYAQMMLWQCPTTPCDSLVYFYHSNCIENATFMTYNLLESPQFSELSFNIGFPANLFSISTSYVIVTGRELSGSLFFKKKPCETQNKCIYLLSHNFLHLAQSFL